MNIVASILVLINAIIPRLADENVANRYAAQMELQALAANASRPGAEAERVEFGTILAGKVVDTSVPQPARVWMVRMLEYAGGAEAVPSLAKLMEYQDLELRDCARRALEKNSAAEASAALRSALEKVSDPTFKVGLINSLGQRGDAQAVKLIIPCLNDEPCQMAAAQALARIATDEAVAALTARMPTAKGTAVAQALIEAANGQLAKGNSAGAQAIYTRLYAVAPESVRAAAFSGLIKVNPGGASQLVEKALTGNESKLQQAALSAAAQSGDKGIVVLVASLLPKLSTSLKAQAVSVLDSPAAEPQVIECVADPDEGVRRASIEALGRLGTQASVPVLLKAATEQGKPGRSTSEAALAKISGQGALAALEKAAGEGEIPVRVVAINALAARKDTASLPAMLRYATESDSTVRKAAYGALRVMGADAELEPLAKLALKAKSPDAFNALEAVAGRANDKAAASKQLLAVAGTDEEALGSLLDSLSAVGGTDALAVVTKLLASKDADTQESAVRALGNWPDFAATGKLMEIATDPNAKTSRHNQALQGLVRLVKSCETEPAQSRVEVALSALAATRSTEEKKLVLSAIATVPHAKAADAIRPLLTDASLKAEAGFAGIGVANALLKSDKDAAKALARDVKAANISRDLNRRSDSILNR